MNCLRLLLLAPFLFPQPTWAGECSANLRAQNSSEVAQYFFKALYRPLPSLKIARIFDALSTSPAIEDNLPKEPKSPQSSARGLMVAASLTTVLGFAGLIYPNYGPSPETKAALIGGAAVALLISVVLKIVNSHREMQEAEWNHKIHIKYFKIIAEMDNLLMQLPRPQILEFSESVGGVWETQMEEQDLFNPLRSVLRFQHWVAFTDRGSAFIDTYTDSEEGLNWLVSYLSWVTKLHQILRADHSDLKETDTLFRPFPPASPSTDKLLFTLARWDTLDPTPKDLDPSHRISIPVHVKSNGERQVIGLTRHPNIAVL